MSITSSTPTTNGTTHTAQSQATLIADLYGDTDAVQAAQNVARQAFRHAVSEVADLAKASLPESTGRIDLATKIVLAGDVDLLDGGKALVASQANGAVEYTVCNGVCECPDYAHAPASWCKHRLAAAVQKRALALVNARLEASPPPEPTRAPSALALPEAPASVNVHITLAGRQVQVTLRDTDETRLLARLTTLLAQYPVEVASPLVTTPHVPQASWCAVHQVTMKENHKDGRTWFSHRQDDGSWCKGKAR